jgi:hypothetical protein
MMTTVGIEPRERTIWRATWVYGEYKSDRERGTTLNPQTFPLEDPPEEDV